ncbi:methionyl-tRNA formyltransferase [Sphingomonas sp. JC676]|uniref:methionyl-tRNA formyltransferase n=1 Tax=Sphingomonas sp. JC676 TaxID=2768065 RepID=UPI0016579909|nr:formyltransferase family protein [Sphingomonas sp. JC676]MBC9031377.1 methionyl-tRNA formyltransferase [Sphingomonas sp. JC676]
MRALLIGAVESTRIAADAISCSPGWTLAAIATLPPHLAHRHSDFVDLTEPAAVAKAPLLYVPNINSDEFLSQMNALAPDITFVIGWSQLCGDAFRNAARGWVLGYHPAALPRLRGRGVIPWTILLDEKITASTLFWIDEGTDSGPIVAQRYMHVAPDETAGSLYAKHMAALGDLLVDTLPRLFAGDRAGEPQDEIFATWAARRRPDDGRIDWTRTAADVERLVRAVGRPYPGAFAGDGDRRVTIWSAERQENRASHHALPGQVIGRADDSFVVHCGDEASIFVSDFAAPGGKPPPLHSMVGA